jgi:hypothetical protein
VVVHVEVEVGVREVGVEMGTGMGMGTRTGMRTRKRKGKRVGIDGWHDRSSLGWCDKVGSDDVEVGNGWVSLSVP